MTTAATVAGRRDLPVRAAAEPAHGLPVRILLLDRSRLLADVLGRRLLAEPDVTAVGVASSPAEAARLLTEANYAVVVATPEYAAELGAARVSSISPHHSIPVVVLAEPDDRSRAAELFAAGGIAGWIGRDRSGDDLMTVIRSCLRGDACVPIDILNAIAARPARHGEPQSRREQVLATLTEREIDVLLLLEQGFGRAEIATQLQLSPNTVRTHVQRILRRLNVHSTLAALALIRS